MSKKLFKEYWLAHIEEIDRLKSELEEAEYDRKMALIDEQNLVNAEMEIKELERQLAGAREEIDKTYKAWCGRNYEHLPLNEAVGALIIVTEKEARQEAAREMWKLFEAADTCSSRSFDAFIRTFKQKFKLEG